MYRDDGWVRLGLKMLPSYMLHISGQHKMKALDAPNRDLATPRFHGLCNDGIAPGRPRMVSRPGNTGVPHAKLNIQHGYHSAQKDSDRLRGGSARRQ